MNEQQVHQFVHTAVLACRRVNGPQVGDSSEEVENGGQTSELACQFPCRWLPLVSIKVSVDTVTLCRAQLVPGWVIALGWVNQNQAPRSNQPEPPLGTCSEYPAKAGVVNKHTVWYISLYPRSCSVSCWLVNCEQRRCTGSSSALAECLRWCDIQMQWCDIQIHICFILHEQVAVK